jgi:hypothetical protein
MIPSLHISGFKLFRDLELPKLGSLNLFVGKNNTGKTCLLEAVELYASSSPWDILRVASRREPDGIQPREERNYSAEKSTNLQPLLNFFHRENSPADLRLYLSAGTPEADLEFQCSPFLPELLDEPFYSEHGKLDSTRRRTYPRDLLEERFVMIRGRKSLRRPLFLHLHLRGLPMPKEILEAEGWLHPDAAPVAFLPARGFTNSEAKKLWDIASLADKDEMLLAWLRFIEPEVLDIRYISDPESGSDVPYLKINGDRGRIPLASMGDGMTRLFHIGLAMANASGGILLIDEFENGLHWEVQKQLWTALFEAANQFGVQVFATTHSNDCIQAFVDAKKDRLISSENYVYRLERRGDDIHAHEFSLQGLEAAIRHGIEVR